MDGLAQFGFTKIDSIEVEKNGSLLTNAWGGGVSHAQFSNFDANFDGIEDLFVFDRVDNSIQIYIRNSSVGDINFTRVDSLSKYFPKDLRNWVLLRDYNCDGLKDIFTSTPGGTKIYRNDSQGGILSFTFVEDQLRGTAPPPNTNINVDISSADIPAIEDIDGDGDLDILAFGTSRNSIIYYKNNSMEDYGVCDSLIATYELKNDCWGHFSESNIDNQIELNSTYWYCQNTDVVNPEMPESEGSIEKSARHSGSTVLALDLDGNTVFDLVLGDISYNNLVSLENGGTTPNSDSPIVSVDYNFPSNTTPVDLEVFPASFYVDVTNDGVRDLLVSTNLPYLSLDHHSVLYYENIGTDATPNFIYRTNQFLQDSMINVGTQAYPKFFDHNQDGLLDLVIGLKNRFDEDGVSSNYETKVQYYENIGTAQSPKFKFITDDYQSLSSLGLGSNFIPSFGDLDNDGDEDMILGNSDGNVHYFENTAGSGNPANFSLSAANLQDDNSNPINTNTYSAPQIVDLNRDGLLDLVLGRKDGKLSYYQNIGSQSSFIFSHRTDNLGGVSTVEYLDVSGYSVPQFVDYNGEYHLFLGSKSGRLYYYNDIDNNITGNFNLVDSIALGIQESEYTGIAVGQLFQNKPFTMIMGTARGGLKLFQNNDGLHIGIEELISKDLEISIYPNPAKSQLTVRDPNGVASSYKIFSLSGQVVSKGPLNGINQLNIASISNGMYIIQLQNKETIIYSDKFVKE